MNTILLSENNQKKLDFRLRSDRFSKQCAVLLGFLIPISTAATHVVLTGLILGWFLAGNLQEKLKIIYRHPVARMALGFFGVFLIGCLYSKAPTSDRIMLVEKMSKLLYIPFLLPLMREEKWRRAVIGAFVSAMLLTFLLSILKVYAGLPITNRFTEACVFKDHIYTNLMMAFSSFIMGHYMFLNVNLRVRILLGCLLAGLIFYIFFMSQGRSGYVIFAVLWSLFFLQRFKLKNFLLGMLGLILLLGLVWISSLTFQKRVSYAIHNLKSYRMGDFNSSDGLRLEYLDQTWKLSKQSPWIGFGTGSFKEVYRAHSLANHTPLTDNPHNEYLNVFLQLGLLGIGALLALFGSILKNSYYLPTLEKWLAQGLGVAMMIGCLMNSWLLDFTSGYFFVILVGACFGALNLDRLKSKRTIG